MGVTNLVEDQPDDHAARIAAFALQARPRTCTRAPASSRCVRVLAYMLRPPFEDTHKSTPLG